MNQVSSLRLYVLRALYLFIVVGLGLLVWPGQSAIVNCSFVVLVYLAVPWGYVFKHYVQEPGEHWNLPLARRSSEVAQ